jgi:hypothetical protein
MYSLSSDSELIVIDHTTWLTFPRLHSHPDQFEISRAWVEPGPYKPNNNNNKPRPPAVLNLGPASIHLSIYHSIKRFHIYTPQQL